MRRSAPLRTIPASLTVIIVYSTTVTFTACSPLVPLPISNSTTWRSLSDLKPLGRDAREVYEDLLAVLPGNESVAFLAIEPFYSTFHKR